MTVTYDDPGTLYDAPLVTYDGRVFLPGLAPPRYWHVAQAAFGTSPPADTANSTVTPAGTLNVGGWTTLSGLTAGGAYGNMVRDWSGTRTSQNKSSGDAEPGTATLILDNINGWLDPTNPGSPYYGYLVPGVPLRVLLTDGIDVWGDWRGFVSSWPRSQGPKGIQDAVIDCYDALGWCGSAPPLFPTEMHKVTLDSAPSSYWPHDDASGMSIRDLISGWDAGLVGTAAMSGPALTVEGLGGSCEFTDQPGSTAQPLPACMPAPPFTVSFLIRTFAQGTVPSPAYYFQAGGTRFGKTLVSSAGVHVVSTGGVTRNAFWDGGGGGALIGAGGPYLLTMTYDTAGTLQAWVGGALAGSTSGAFLDPGPALLVAWGALAASSTGTGTAAQISHMAFWQRVLTPTEIAARTAAALNGRNGEAVVNRIGYLLDRAGWPTSMRNLVLGGAANVGPLQLGGNKTTLDLLREGAQYEDGILGVTAAGRIFFYPRYQNPGSSFALGGRAAPIDASSTPPVFSTNDTTMVTSASVSTPPVVYDAGVSLANGRTVTMTQQAHSPDEAWVTAERAVRLGSTPRPAVDSLTVDPVDVPAAATLDLGAVGTVNRYPIWSPTTPVAEAQQVTSITSTGGGGKPAKKTYAMQQPRLAELRLSTGTATNPTGAAANNLARFDPTANLVVECQFRLNDWVYGSASGTQVLVAHDNPGTGAGWMLYWTGTAVPQIGFAWADNAGVGHGFTSLPVVRAGTRWLWVKAVFATATGGVIFYVSPSNRDSYAVWGSGVMGATTVRASADKLWVGQVGGGGGNPTRGDILTALVATAAGTPVATFDPTADDQGAGVGPSSWTSSTGETWATQGSGLLAPT